MDYTSIDLTGKLRHAALCTNTGKQMSSKEISKACMKRRRVQSYLVAAQETDSELHVEYRKCVCSQTSLITSRRESYEAADWMTMMAVSALGLTCYYYNLHFEDYFVSNA